MSKVTLDMAAFKALASDTRLDILKVLDGKKMSLKDISNATNLNKATLHEHLLKLNEAGLVKKNEREGHKWVYYKLTWKGECLFHPENTRIVVLFSVTFMTLFVGIIQLVSYVKGVIIGKVETIAGSTNLYLSLGGAYDVSDQSKEMIARTAADNVGVKGLMGNSPAPKDFDFEPVINGADEAAEFAVGGHGGSWDNFFIDGSETSNVPLSQQMIIWRDPNLQWIAIACIIIFSVLLSIGVWRLWKNRKPKF